MNKKILIAIGILLLGVGLVKPSFINNLFNVNNNVVVIDEIELVEPKSEALKEKAKNIISALSVNSDRKVDGKRLASLYNDIAALILLDGKDEIVRNTEEVRQANRLSGLILKLNIKDKYPDLAEANQALIVEAMGDDNIPLTKELREKAVEGFMALAWACNEGSK